eukprot:SAG11_NODE_24026_length_379_cov_0.742857_2_plen_49_part_01
MSSHLCVCSTVRWCGVVCYEPIVTTHAVNMEYASIAIELVAKVFDLVHM